MGFSESSSNFQLPKLIRLRILALHAEHTPVKGVSKLEASIQEIIEVEDQYFSNSTTGKENERSGVLVRIDFEGNWIDSQNNLPVISFKAKYEVNFAFKVFIDQDHLKELLENKEYRDFLVAQAYPLASSHYTTQLGLMGVNTTRALGFDTNVEQEEVQILTAEHKPKKVRKPRKNKTETE